MSENINKKLEKHFKSRDSIRIEADYDYVRASVAVILHIVDTETSILLIKRTENPSDSYSGHVAFPGGKINSEDKSPVDTAVRETFEEVGIDLNYYGTYLGRLDDIKPLNPDGPKFIVTPFVFILNEAIKPTINDIEVEDSMWVSLGHLSDQKNSRVRIKQRGDRVIEDYVYSYEKYIIWGMTGKIINSFIKEVSVLI